MAMLPVPGASALSMLCVGNPTPRSSGTKCFGFGIVWLCFENFSGKPEVALHPKSIRRGVMLRAMPSYPDNKNIISASPLKKIIITQFDTFLSTLQKNMIDPSRFLSEASALVARVPAHQPDVMLQHSTRRSGPIPDNLCCFFYLLITVHSVLGPFYPFCVEKSNPRFISSRHRLSQVLRGFRLCGWVTIRFSLPGCH